MKNSSSPGRVLTTDEVKRLARQLVPRYSQRVCGVISAALKSGVELYTRVRVRCHAAISTDHGTVPSRPG